MRLKYSILTRTFSSILQARQPLKMAPSRRYSERQVPDVYNESDSFSRNGRVQSAVAYETPRRRAHREVQQSEYEQRRGSFTDNNSGEPSTQHDRRDVDLYRTPRGEDIYNYHYLWPSTRRPQSYQYNFTKQEEYHHSTSDGRESFIDPVPQRSTRSSRREPSIDLIDNWRANRRQSFTDSQTSRTEPSLDTAPYHYSNSRRDYQRQPYRPMAVPDDFYNDRSGSPVCSRGYKSQSPRPNTKKEEGLRSQPRKGYDLGTFAPPNNYPTDKEPPRPLPLLVLDLNGTLVCRDVGTPGKNNKNNKDPVLRPYLKSFLQYCLAVPDSSSSLDEQQDTWNEWEINRSKDSKAKPHGAHFWQGGGPPKAKEDATFRLLLWSSAQPHNVDSMARAILSPEQAEQLLRIYARDTLVTRRLYSQKAPSIKDLEILWAVLNSDNMGKESEARLFAEARNREDVQSPDMNGKRSTKSQGRASERAAEEAQNNVILPKLNDKGKYKDGKGYGQHNTLLLDDSVDKAKLQPFNHLLLPEFDRERAIKTKIAKESPDNEEKQKSNRNYDKDMGLDNVLLQVIGVLEHARYQVNVSCWIRFGGLGDFGGMKKKHPYYLEEGLNDKEMKVDEKIIEQAFQYFSKPFSSIADANFEPRLFTPVNERTVTFWVQEGKRALLRHGIPLQRF